MATGTKTEDEVGDSQLPASSATCPICLSILVHPVTTPCHHTLCTPCFEATIEQAGISCPICRARLSTWLRRARKAGSLVDEPLWQRLQLQYADKVQARLEGRDADFSQEANRSPPLRLSAPGEIRAEFEQQLASARDEENERLTRSDRASRQLIERLQCETAARAKQEEEDARVARGVLQREMLLSSPPIVSRPGKKVNRLGGAPRRGPMDVYMGQLTPRPDGKQPASPQPRPSTSTDADMRRPTETTAAAPPLGAGKENCDPSATTGPARLEQQRAEPTHLAAGAQKRTRAAGDTGVTYLVRTLSGNHGNDDGPAVRSADVAAQLPLRRGLSSAEICARLADSDSEDDPAIPGGSPLIPGGKRPLSFTPAASTAKRRAVTATVTSNSSATRSETASQTYAGGDRPPLLEPETLTPSSTVQDLGYSAVQYLGDSTVQCPAAGSPRATPIAGVAERPGAESSRVTTVSGVTERPVAVSARVTPAPGVTEPAAAEFEGLDWVSPELLAEQREVERLLALERADRTMAERLQKELNRLPAVDRSKGSADAYGLRQGSSRSSGGRRLAARRARSQLSIEETLSGRRPRTGR